MTAARTLCVYVDVDDTLVRSAGSKRIPIPSAIKHVRQLHREGALLYCWSTGGADYARDTATELGISNCFAGFLPKPNVLLDDQAVNSWPEFIHVLPSGCKSLGEYKAALNRS